MVKEPRGGTGSRLTWHFAPLRSLLLPVMSSIGGRVQAVVHWPVEPLYHTISTGGSQRWHQGKHACEDIPQNVTLVTTWTSFLFFFFQSGPWTEGSLGGPSGVGEGDSPLAQCTAGPVQALSPTSPQHRSPQWGEEAPQGYATTQHFGVRPTGEREGFCYDEGLMKAQRACMSYVMSDIKQSTNCRIIQNGLRARKTNESLLRFFMRAVSSDPSL